MMYAIRFEGVSKRYRLGYSSKSLRSTFSSVFTPSKRASRTELWALKDVSFEILPGEAVGLVGQNGAGKSTALRLIAGITNPTSGLISVNGRVSTRWGLGAGFHPELSGRENIFLYGSILGLNRKEIKQEFDRIVAFSEIERFLDTPVKRYSSGMYVRLAFSVAAHIQPDILLVDEVLAVGDAAFRQKCMARIGEMRENGLTLIFVSHNALMVQTVCEKAIYFSQGKLMLTGDVENVVNAYENDLRRGGLNALKTESLFDNRLDHSLVEIEDVAIVDQQDNPKDTFNYNESATIKVAFVSHQVVISPIFHVRLWRDDGTPCFTVRSNQRDTLLRNIKLDKRGEFALRLSPLQLYGGSYRAEVLIVDSSNSFSLTRGYSPWFQVSGPGSLARERMGIYVPHSEWLLDGKEVNGRTDCI